MDCKGRLKLSGYGFRDTPLTQRRPRTVNSSKNDGGGNCDFVCLREGIFTNKIVTMKYPKNITINCYNKIAKITKNYYHKVVFYTVCCGVIKAGKKQRLIHFSNCC